MNVLFSKYLEDYYIKNRSLRIDTLIITEGIKCPSDVPIILLHIEYPIALLANYLL